MDSWGDERGIREEGKEEGSKKKPWDNRKKINGKVPKFKFDRKENELKQSDMTSPRESLNKVNLITIVHKRLLDRAKKSRIIIMT